MVKQFLLLKEKSRERKRSGRFILEGQREIQLVLKGNHTITTVLFYAGIITKENLYGLFKGSSIPEIVEISKEIYQKLAYRETTEGVIAMAQVKTHTLSDLQFKRKEPLLLIAEAPEKPGNIGALLRTADASDLDAVIIADPKGDLYNPNIIRASIGCVFTTQVAVGTSEEIFSFLKTHRIQLFCAALSASEVYTQVNFSGSTAIAVGTEATGLTPKWLEHSDQNILIPMEGQIDSMNVSVAAAILIFEAKRQRKTTY